MNLAPMRTRPQSGYSDGKDAQGWESEVLTLRISLIGPELTDGQVESLAT
jgi:hypothetical protein